MDKQDQGKDILVLRKLSEIPTRNSTMTCHCSCSTRHNNTQYDAHSNNYPSARTKKQTFVFDYFYEQLYCRKKDHVNACAECGQAFDEDPKSFYMGSVFNDRTNASRVGGTNCTHLRCQNCQSCLRKNLMTQVKTDNTYHEDVLLNLFHSDSNVNTKKEMCIEDHISCIGLPLGIFQIYL